MLDRVLFARSQDDENLSVFFLSGFHVILLLRYFTKHN